MQDSTLYPRRFSPALFWTHFATDGLRDGKAKVTKVLTMLQIQPR